MMSQKKNITVHFLTARCAIFDQVVKSICRACSYEPHLLRRSYSEVHQATKDLRVLVAVDMSRNYFFVGSLILWDLTVDEHGDEWVEAGSLYVRPEYRFPMVGYSVCDMLYQAMLENFSGSNIVSTTTNPNGYKAGLRNGLLHVGFDRLPQPVQHSTCTCDIADIKAAGGSICSMRRNCFARVSANTWQRITAEEDQTTSNLEA